jgi:uncharacterized integral membrane protein
MMHRVILLAVMEGRTAMVMTMTGTVMEKRKAMKRLRAAMSLTRRI